MDSSSHRPLADFEQTCTTPDRESKKGLVVLKEYVNTSELSKQDLKHDATGSDRTVCTYCGEPVGSDARITIEDLNISCHPSCFKCGICRKPMGDLLYNMFLRRGTVHCESCYAKVI